MLAQAVSLHVVLGAQFCLYASSFQLSSAKLHLLAPDLLGFLPWMSHTKDSLSKPELGILLPDFFLPALGHFSVKGVTIHTCAQTGNLPLAITLSPLTHSVPRYLVRNLTCPVPRSGAQTSYLSASPCG